MEKSLMAEVIGTLMELSVFFYAFYILLGMKRKQIKGMVLIYICMVTGVVYLNHLIAGYASFIYIFSTMFVLKLFSKDNFFKVMLIFVMTMFGVVLAEIVLIPLTGLVVKIEVYQTIIVLFIVNLMTVYVLTRFRRDLTLFVEKYETKYINFMALNSFIYLFVLKVIFDYNANIILDNVLYFTIVVVVLMIVNYFIYKEVATISERTKVLMVQEEMRETLDQMVNDIRMRQHEYRNHLTTIQGFMDTSTPNEAVEQTRAYLEDIYSDDFNDGELLSLDRNILKAVLFMKRNEARERGIDFQFAAYASFKGVDVLDYELSIVLNNLLNNAFDAVKGLDDRHVLLEIGYDETLQSHYLLTKNSGVHVPPEHLTKFTEKQFTTKREEKGSHGFGLWNVNNIVKKYRGLVYVYFEQDDIVFKVTFA